MITSSIKYGIFELYPVYIPILVLIKFFNNFPHLLISELHLHSLRHSLYLFDIQQSGSIPVEFSEGFKDLLLCR